MLDSNRCIPPIPPKAWKEWGTSLVGRTALSGPIPYSLFPIPCSYDARASSIMGASRCEPLRGPRLRALITLMRSSSS